jgi:hypothetical protein
MTRTAHRPRSTRLALLAGISLFVGATVVSDFAYAAKSLPEISPEGLVLVPKTRVSAVYLREGADFSGYDKLMILDCQVAFRKDWQRDQNRSSSFKVADEDVTRIKTELADEFKKIFTTQLSAKGETIAMHAGTGVLTLRPAIVNLDIKVPDTLQAGRTRTFSASAGQATVFLELYDSVTGDLLARAIDVEEAGNKGYISIRNGAANRQDAQRMLRKWAELLGTFLHNARASTATPGTDTSQ